MWNRSLSILSVVAIASLSHAQDPPGRDASNSRPLPSYANSSGYDAPVTPPGRPNPYGNYQTTSATADLNTTGPMMGPNANCTTCGDSSARCALHGWFGVDYMLTFPSRTRVPTLFNDPAGNPAAGNSPDMGVSHGIRINTGTWICDGQLGLQGIAVFSFRSYVNSTTPAGTIPLALAPIPATNFVYQTWHQYGGGEGNTLYRLLDDGDTKVYAIAGTRYLSIEEDLSTIYQNNGTNFLDQFHTRNQFAGLQFGAKVAHHLGMFDIDATAKLAVGVNYSQLWILGSNDGAQNVQAFTQRSNIGFYESNYFGLIPEVDLNVRYRITQRITANVGYMFLMSINNWRPGEQVSLNFPPVNAPPIRSSYFLHGLTAGLSFSY